MKKITFLLLLESLIGCFGRHPAVITGLEGQPMPSFSLMLMDSTTRLNTISIPVGKPIVLFMLSPNCPYCRAQTEEIIHNIKSLDKVRVYIISPSGFTSVRSFYEHYQLKKYSTITIGQDYEAYFSNYFKASAVPYIAIYSKEKLLKQVLIGKVSANEIKDIALK